MMLIIAAKIKLKNSAKSESSVPRKEPNTSPNFISPKPSASFRKAQVPIAPIINRVPPNANTPYTPSRIEIGIRLKACEIIEITRPKMTNPFGIIK